MIVIPAIDLKDGRCVRLRQGRKEEVTQYSDSPVEVARRWVSMGATLIHIVDLDGAFTGSQANLHSIKEIRDAVDVTLQVGGGIRQMERIEGLLRMGIDRVILGTSALREPELVREAARRYPDRILVGIDARNGRVAIKGWQEVTEVSALQFARQMERSGVAGIIYTDISRDGMLTGPNFRAIEEIVGTVDIPVIASGGVSSLEDIKKLRDIRDLWGVIVGKALYTGRVDLAEAIALCANSSSP